jgi:hypothetical protein
MKERDYRMLAWGFVLGMHGMLLLEGLFKMVLG